jgi:2'-hydroxyisoflavone reductase
MAAFANLPRRDFLRLCGLTLAGCATSGRAQPAARPLRILVLGGTGFVGPGIVTAARARGHVLTLFNRGKTNPGLFPGVETILGDRRTDIDRLKGREWDAVIDTWVMLPKSVRAITELLRDHIGHYLFVSTISVYKLGREPIDENSPTMPPVDEDPAGEFTPARYGGWKAMCERAAEERMPGRTTAVRSGVIVGPGDPSDRFIYWPLRLARGGEVLAPGTPQDRLQFIDVRDLGAWIVSVVEQRVMGTYNVVGPRDPSLGAVLAAVKAGVKSDARLEWVEQKWLESHEAGGWKDFPLVVLADDEQSGFGHVSAARALARGLTFRDPTLTARDALAWWNAQTEERRAQKRMGMSPEREEELLRAWHARGSAALAAPPGVR